MRKRDKLFICCQANFALGVVAMHFCYTWHWIWWAGFGAAGALINGYIIDKSVEYEA